MLNKTKKTKKIKIKYTKNRIIKRITKSLYMMLEKPNKDNKYLVKY